jgi:peptidoglycan/LPS O-acetylase OafA/YrhL
MPTVTTERISFDSHLKVLDGWRGVSIVLVLITHLVPLGQHANTAVGILGMSLFFTLSGFLITSSLLRSDASLRDFVIRRVFRIVPLAWLYFVIVFMFQTETPRSWIAHFLFYANLPPPQIRLATDHIWSLCVEMQFYLGVAILFALFRARGLLALPLLAFLFTGMRIAYGVSASSITWFRIDEILAGCLLALAWHGRLGKLGQRMVAAMRAAPQGLVLVLVAISSLYQVEGTEWITYFRPYLAAFVVGATLANRGGALVTLLDRRWLYYLAAISYALYVIHLGLTQTWLGSGDLVEKYAKRPLLLVVLFGLAHLSTFRFEHPMILLGKRLAHRLSVPAVRSLT